MYLCICLQQTIWLDFELILKYFGILISQIGGSENVAIISKSVNSVVISLSTATDSFRVHL